MKQLYILLTLCFFVVTVNAQKGSAKGVAYDTLFHRPVGDATVTILDKKDSSLVSFTMTDDAGRFSITGLANGDYRVLITHISYHNSNSVLHIDDANKNVELGNIIMNDKTRVLDEVVVRSEAPPVTLVGDTVLYNAGSFKTPPNASVEQLLKKLPGVQVQKDGSIKAQGQTVGKVLVDGKEFFGNDPKMATKNLPADAVDKVQVYDKQSDQSQLTGFDDGNSEKTINLKLKKDKKKGAFGKVRAGAGTDDRKEGGFNYNSFKGARQFSAIGMANNTNAEAFSFMDMMNFTGELSKMMRGGGGGGNININISQDDAAQTGGGANNKGIRTIWGGGLNYNNIIGTKLDLTSNYFYNHFEPKINSTIQRQYLLPDSSYFFDQHSLSDVVNNSHRVNLGLDYVIDSFNSIKFSPSLGYQQTGNRNMNEYSQSGEDGRISNKGFNNYFSDDKAYNFRSDLLYRKKFRKKGRTFSLSIQSTFNSGTGKGTQESVNEFYSPSSSLFRTDSINQRYNSETDLRGYSARAVYTERVLKNSLLEFSAGKGDSKSNSSRTTYDFNKGSQKFDAVNDSLSNEFENKYGYSNAGLRFRTQKKRYSYAVGFSWQHAVLEGKVIGSIKDSVIGKSFNNLLPVANFKYNFTRFKNLAVNYRAFTNQPSVSQLQPLPDISNPLAIKEGNPNLKQEYTHNVQINYMGLNPFKNKNLFAFFNLNRTDNKIVNSDSIFSSGIRKTRPVNVNGVYNLNGDINLGMPARFVKGRWEVGSNLSFFKTRQFINGKENRIQTFSAGPRLSMEMNPTQTLSVTLRGGMNFNRTKYSLQPNFNNDYFSQEYETEISWDLPKGLHLGTDFVYTINNQLAAGFNTRVPLWSASISKQCLKFNRGEIKFSVNDLLNQNIGASRSSNQNYIEDSRYNSLRRFALLSFTYSLSKVGLGGESNNGARIIVR